MSIAKKRVLQALLLAAIALACALAVLPARWLLRVLPAAGPLVLVDANGSIWAGSATLAIGQPPLRRTLPEPLRWKVEFAGGPRVVVTHPGLGGALLLTPGWRGVRVSAQTLRLPAAVLSALHAALAALNPDGELVWRWPETVVGFAVGLAPQPAGRLLFEMEWNQAVSALARVRPLGAYRVAFTQTDAGVEFVLSTSSGPLMLQWQGAVDAVRGVRGVRGDGTARVDAQASTDVRAALQPLLDALGPAQGDHHLLRLR